MFYADVEPAHPDGHPRIFIQPTQGGDNSLLCVIKGKLASLTEDIPTLRMDHIPMIMQGYVFGVPSIWLRLL